MHGKQPEILRYLQCVAEKYDLRRDIRFSTRVENAVWNEESTEWRIGTSNGPIECRFLIMASGCLSVPKTPDVPSTDKFDGEVSFTSRWPHEGVDFHGKRVAVIGTGSSGLQSIPIIAAQASQLTAFQRTPSFSRPAKNGPFGSTDRWQPLGFLLKQQLGSNFLSVAQVQYPRSARSADSPHRALTRDDILVNAADVPWKTRRFFPCGHTCGLCFCRATAAARVTLNAVHGGWRWCRFHTPATSRHCP